MPELAMGSNMVTRDEVERAVDKAKELLEDSGISVDTTVDQLIDWYETDLPRPDDSLADVILNTLIVVHDLVEIDEVLKMGLEITKDVIIKNPEKVDDAHLKAARIELMIARSIGAVGHFRERIANIERWCVEETLSEARKADYRQLLREAKEHLASLENRQPTPAL